MLITIKAMEGACRVFNFGARPQPCEAIFRYPRAVVRRPEPLRKPYVEMRLWRGFWPPGSAAPDFWLRVTPGQYLSLGDLAGKPVILAFCPADWSPVCGDQMALYNQVLPEFRRHEAEPQGISVDGAWHHEAFSQARHLHFPLLADFEPKGDVAKRYGAT
jgi:peroxiredoxin